MSTTSYLRAELDGLRFAVPSSSLIKIVPDPIAVSVPDAPKGICGIVYEEGAVLPIRSLDPERRNPAELVVLCGSETGRAAYAADRVAAMGELTDDERAKSEPAEEELASASGMEDISILLLSGSESHD